MLVDVEGEAAWLLRDFDRPPGARRLVAHHLGVAVMTVRGMRGRDAETFTFHGRQRIAVRGRLGPVALRWALLHELAEWHLGAIGYREPDAEDAAEALAAALAAPRRAFLRAARHAPETRLPELAAAFAVTETCAALRVGEVLDVPLVVVAPHRCRVRGAPWGWPETEEQLRRLVKLPPWPGTRRVELTDARRRVVLLAAA